MINQENRPYRKSLAEHGLIYLGGEEREVVIKNISLTGLLVELFCEDEPLEIKDIYNAIAASPVLDFYLPELRLAGEVDVVRVDIEESHILMALAFKYVSHDVDNLLYRRKAYRKMMTAPGKILIDGDFTEFETVNVSVDGFMIRINKDIEVPVNAVTTFQFKLLDLEGAVKVIWIDRGESSTLMGLQYMHMEKTHIQGIPVFARR
ncbi:MAG: PilZ domain-containing protein [Methylococcaceae bacterium]|nr:PilZ domain-containing protein [Methylococcaceae bacterium]